MAAKKRKPKIIELLRIGNPMMVGANVARVVPVYVLHNLIAPDFQKHSNLDAIKHLAFSAEIAIQSGLAGHIPNAQSSHQSLQETTFGLISPEARIFRSKATGGAHTTQGAPFPLVGGLATPQASDDGMGKHLRRLMENANSDWRKNLKKLFLPETATDPATGFVMTLMDGTSGSPKDEGNTDSGSKPDSKFDNACVEFVSNLTAPQTGAQRIATIRDLALGAFFVSLVRLVVSPAITTNETLPLVFVYGGIPPGKSRVPLVHAAFRSFDIWISKSWRATSDLLAQKIGKTPTLSDATTPERREQAIQILLSERLGNSEAVVKEIIEEAVKPNLDEPLPDEAWCRHLMSSKDVGFPRSELSRRIRIMGSSIGLVAPDRGRANPRLVVDTPLLGVLTKGVIGEGTMEFRKFVTRLSECFGLVLGPGDNDDIVDELELSGFDGVDAYEILVENQELFRERLLRTGLARSYSDSHTEVLGFNESLGF